MEQILDSSGSRRSYSKDEFHLLFPGKSAWENWVLRPGNKPLLQSSLSPQELSSRLKGRFHLAVPLQHLLIIPLWLATRDISIMKEMVALQLESRGLTGSASGSMFDYSIVRQEGDRSLLSVSTLSENFPPELCIPRIIHYRPAAEYWELPCNHILFWRELGHLILAFTDGSQLIYAQSSAGKILSGSLIYEAHCARLILESEGSLGGVLGVATLGDFSSEETELLRALCLPVRRLDRPSLCRSSKGRSLLPLSVFQSRTRDIRIKGKRKILWCILIVYLMIIAVALGQLGWLSLQASALEREMAPNRQQVRDIRGTSEIWQAMEPAILPEAYPVEMLYRCTRKLPEEGVRFVSYDQAVDRILIIGEAKNAPIAFQYLETLKKSPELDAYTWEMPPPVLMSDESAQFQMEGKRKDATLQIQ